MKRIFIILILSAAFLGACSKKSTVRTYGIDTIDNLRYNTIAYEVYGFSFSQAKLVGTNASSYDIIVDLYNDIIDVQPRPALQANNLKPSFFKIADYGTEDEAKTAFDNLKTVPQPQQWLDIADYIAANQIWIYRSDNEKYTKIRIVEVKNEKMEKYVDYAECKFQWVHQPDGSVNFP